MASTVLSLSSWETTLVERRGAFVLFSTYLPPPSSLYIPPLPTPIKSDLTARRINPLIHVSEFSTIYRLFNLFFFSFSCPPDSPASRRLPSDLFQFSFRVISPARAIIHIPDVIPQFAEVRPRSSNPGFNPFDTIVGLCIALRN